MGRSFTKEDVMFWQIVACFLCVVLGFIWGIFVSWQQNIAEATKRKLEFEKIKLEMLHLQNELYIAENDRKLK